MTIDSNHYFDVIDRWAALSDSELINLYSDVAIATLQRVVEMLCDTNQGLDIRVDRNNFVHLIHNMKQIKRDGSRRLGEAILQASDFLDQNQPSKAIEVYESFIETSCGTFYRDIARVQLSKIRFLGE